MCYEVDMVLRCSGWLSKEFEFHSTHAHTHTLCEASPVWAGSVLACLAYSS